MGVILTCMSWETTQEPIDMPIIVALEGVLACTSLGEEHRGPWGLSGQAGERQTERQTDREGAKRD